MSQSVQALEVRRLSGSLGAEVRGLSLGKAGPGDADRIKALLLEHLVLFFPDQHLSPDEHIGFAPGAGPVLLGCSAWRRRMSARLRPSRPAPPRRMNSRRL
jgi:alpha-ketoglutarate-dependent taurine dioxygenase